MSTNLQDTYSLGRAWRYANPRMPTDYLPAVYGDIKGGNYGLWNCPCIDTVNFYYLIADHTILSAGNGNDFTVYNYANVAIDSAGYTIVDDHTDENGAHVAIINFTDDQALNELISIRCKGKNDGAALIENPVTILEDFVVNLAGGASADFDAFALQKAKDVCTDYKAAGLITGDSSIGTTLSEILYSFHGEWWKNHQDNIVIQMNTTDQVYAWKGELLERNIKKLSATRDEKNLCNIAEVQYAWNYKLFKYEEGDDGSSTADQLSRNVHGDKIKTFDFKWCRDATTIAAVQAIIINRLKDPIWMIRFDEVTLRNLHFEKGDFVLLNHSTLYDTAQLPFADRIVQVLTKVTAINDKTINFELIDKGVSYHSLSESVAEIVNITEVIAKSVTKNVAEQLAVTETIAKSVTKSLTDGVSIAETISKYIEKGTIEEIINITEVIAKGVTKNLAESVAVSEVIAKEITKAVSEGASISEVITKYIQKTAPESLAISEQAILNDFRYDGIHYYNGSFACGEDYTVL